MIKTFFHVVFPSTRIVKLISSLYSYVILILCQMATALNYDLTKEKTNVKNEVTPGQINNTYRDANNWSPAHIYHEISGYTKLSDINKKDN